MSEEVKKTDGLVTLESIVANVKNDLRDYSSRGKKRLLQFAIRGVTQMNLYYLTNIEVMYFSMSDIYTVDLPSDYIDYTAIAININGRLWTLSLNNDIMLPRDTLCGEVTREANELYGENADSVSSVYYYADHYDRCYRYITSLYSLGGGYNTAYHRIDKERRQIVFQSELQRTDGVLEYISSGVNLSGKTYIPRQAEEAVIAFVHWKNIERDMSVPAGRIQMAEKRYWDEVGKLGQFEGSFTIQEFLDSKYKTSKQSPKR